MGDLGVGLLQVREVGGVVNGWEGGRWRVEVHYSCIGIRLVLGMREYIVIGMDWYCHSSVEQTL